MKTLKKIISMAIAAIISCTALVSCSGGSDNAKLERDIKVYALKGPTGMCMAKLMSDSDAGTTTNKYDFTIASAPDEVTAEIIKGNYDIAALPTNLASVLYNKTEGKIRVAAVNTLGVLYVLENGDTVNSLEDLNGKELYATGQGSTPEYILRYVLETNGIDCNRLVASGETPIFEKYDRFIPGELLRSAYAADRLRADEAEKRIKEILSEF